MTGSNRRQPVCKTGALPTELIPHIRPPVYRVVGQCSSLYSIIPIISWATVVKMLIYHPHIYAAILANTMIVVQFPPRGGKAARELGDARS